MNIFNIKPILNEDCQNYSNAMHFVFRKVNLTPSTPATLALVAMKMFETRDEAGLRIWQCTECEYARHKKDHVTKHVEQKHSGLQFVCEYCQSVFHRRDTYREHVKKKHSLNKF